MRSSPAEGLRQGPCAAGCFASGRSVRPAECRPGGDDRCSGTSSAAARRRRARCTAIRYSQVHKLSLVSLLQANCPTPRPISRWELLSYRDCAATDAAGGKPPVSERPGLLRVEARPLRAHRPLLQTAACGGDNAEGLMPSVGAASRWQPAPPQQELAEDGHSAADASGNGIQALASNAGDGSAEGDGAGNGVHPDFTQGLPAVAADDAASRRGLLQLQSEASPTNSAQLGCEDCDLDELFGMDDGDDETVQLEGQMAWFSMKDVARISTVDRRCYIHMTEVVKKQTERELKYSGLRLDAG